MIVVPEATARRMMSLNVEQGLNIRERATIALAIYRELLEERPQLAEDDGELVDTIEHAHLVTLGLAYEGNGRLAGSSYEAILQKCDGFVDEPLEAAYPGAGPGREGAGGGEGGQGGRGRAEGERRVALDGALPDHQRRQPHEAGAQAVGLRHDVRQVHRQAHRARRRAAQGAQPEDRVRYRGDGRPGPHRPRRPCRGDGPRSARASSCDSSRSSSPAAALVWVPPAASPRTWNTPRTMCAGLPEAEPQRIERRRGVQYAADRWCAAAAPPRAARPARVSTRRRCSPGPSGRPSGRRRTRDRRAWRRSSR